MNKEKLIEAAEKEYPYSDINEFWAQEDIDLQREAYLKGLSLAMPLVGALKGIDEIVLRYNNAFGSNAAANHCRNIAIEALANFPQK